MSGRKAFQPTVPPPGGGGNSDKIYAPDIKIGRKVSKNEK